MRLIIEPNYEQLSKWAANYVAAKIKKANPTAEKPFVLGLPTGSSPLGMYKNHNFQYGRICRFTERPS